MKLIYLLIILASVYCICPDHNTQLDCITSSIDACKWSALNNICLEVVDVNLGCNQQLSQKACLMQQYTPTQGLAECLFTGFCRTLTFNFPTCSTLLSRSACLAVKLAKCVWLSDTCKSLSDSEAISIASETTALKFASISICTLVPSTPTIHQRTIRAALLSYQSSYHKSDSITDLLQYPGCVDVPDMLYSQLNCEADGLNVSACQKISGKACQYINGVCKTVTDFSTLQCSDKVSQTACLSITNINSPCYWDNGACTTYFITATTQCVTSVKVSPSVCAAILAQECFYNSSTQQCSQKCRTSDKLYQQSVCNAAADGCTFKNATCIFQGSQCGLIGQNKLACMAAADFCQFLNGSCFQIKNLAIQQCDQGLNKLACVNLTNPSQVCQFTTACGDLPIYPDMRCDLLNVNVNACQKITTQGCQFSSGNCIPSKGTEKCTTTGLNKIACLATVNTLSACTWDVSSGSCVNKDVPKTASCTSLTLVNAYACRQVLYRESNAFQACKYNSSTYSCETFTDTSTLTCSTAGLNKQACVSVSDTTKACRWLNNQCVEVSSLGKAVSCTSLQNVTFKTCTLLQSVVEKCIFNSNTKSCQSSIRPSTTCTTNGLNTYGCAYLNTSCYFDSTSCKDTTTAILSTIKCDTNYPSKLACLKITTTGAYCKWNNVTSICTQQTYPTTEQCVYLTSANKNLCLAYEINTTSWVESSSYCTYSASVGGCTTYSGTSLVGCGSSEAINIHGCVALSDITKKCYFNTATLVCTEITDNSVLATIACKQGNKLTCTSITTSKAYCQWYEDVFEKKCSSLTSFGSPCASFQKVNQNVCAAVAGTDICKWNAVTTNCESSVDTNIPCNSAGLNEIGCKSSTQQACYFDDVNKLCQSVDSNNGQQVKCNSKVNKLGCLAALGAACYWNGTSCAEVTGKDWTTVTCSSLTDTLYNPIVCSKVSTGGQYCAYNSITYQCKDSDIVPDCQAGYNEQNCDTQSCQFQNYICSTKPSPGTNDCTGKTESQCYDVTTTACVYVSGSCKAMTVSIYMACAQLSSGTNKYNAVTCQSVTKQYEACSYNATTHLCQAVSTNNNLCTVVGLNKYACMNKTIGNNCIFDSNFNSSKPGCSLITNISMETCSNNMNITACTSISSTKGICQFNVADQICNSYEDYQLTGITCADSQNASVQMYTNTYCAYLTSTACQYDTTTKACKNAANVATCAADSSFNYQACLSNVTNETCIFDYITYSCTAMTATTLSTLICSSAVSFKQCTHAGVGTCQWNSGSSICTTLTTLTSSCTSLSSINANTCMQNVNGTEKCQFQDNGTSTACVIPINDIQPCSGLNQVACLANTANSCYYHSNCYDITITPYEAGCDSDYLLTQLACAKIQKPGQTCKWTGTACEKITVSGTCSTYIDASYSPQVCAAITSEACYWNLGCKTGNATNCSVAGANQIACVNATSGNCMFSNYRCYEVLTDEVSSLRCTDPSNQNGCLNLNNGQPCQWSSGACISIAVDGSCTSYTNVNPGVCSQTTDQACIWSSNSCQALSATNKACTDKGLNLKACLTKTVGSKCQYKNLQCQVVDNITLYACEDNLNQYACLSHTTKQCYWNGSSCETKTSGLPTTCASLTNYSKYCCTQITGDKCTYSSSCTTITLQTDKCNNAMNYNACMWLSSPCQYLNNTCSPSNKKTLTCLSSLNKSLCLIQTDFCSYNTQCQSGLTSSCTGLQYTSQIVQCKYVTDTGCYSSSNNGCSVATYTINCTTNNLNQYGCLNSKNQCQWDSSQQKCVTVPQDPPNYAFTVCTSGSYSRGRCSKFKGCAVSFISMECASITISDTTKCSDVNSVSSANSSLCSQVTSEPCMYDSDSLSCTSTITSSDCTKPINKLGCKYVSANCYLLNSQTCATSTTTLYYTCSSIYTRYICLTNILTSCYWDSTLNSCLDYTGPTKACAQFTDAMTSPGVCYYYSSDYCSYQGLKCQLQAAQTTCTAALSPLGCQAAGSTCYWDLYQAKCLSLTNTSDAAYLSCPQLKYSNKNFCILAATEGQICQWTGGFCISAQLSTIKCTDDLALFACMGASKEGQKCIFNTTCQVADNSTTNCTNNLNIYGCLDVRKDGQYCKWLGQKCATLSADGYGMLDHTLINQNVCRRAYTIGGIPQDQLSKIGVKYDEANYACISSDPFTDICTTSGLNYYGCLQSQVAACDWSGSKCINFTDSDSYTTCASYVSVSAKVCASISKNNIKCRQNVITLNCEDSTTIDTCNTIGLNKLACENIINMACVWVSGKCQEKSILLGVDTCSSLKDVNPQACASIDVGNEACRYAGNGVCTSQIDYMVQSCDSAGLNARACSLIESAKCQFNNGKCQFYNSSETQCTNLMNVNALVCKSLDLDDQPCKFSEVLRSCFTSGINDECDQIGLNKQGCSLLSDYQGCQWYNELQKCTCKGLANQLNYKECSNMPKQYCTDSSCLYDTNKAICRLKKCSDYTKTECGGLLNTYQCYLKNGQTCDGAQKCNQIFDVTDCSIYKIFGIQCANDPYNSKHCVDYSCLSVSQSLCGGQCQWSTSGCLQKQCALLNQSECVGTFNKQTCYWNGTNCIGLNSCSDLNKYIVDEVDICSAVTVNNRQCIYQQVKPFSSIYGCSASACRIRGNSKMNCHGAEVNNEVCLILNDDNCYACEEITEICVCMKYSSYCTYNMESNKCISNLCSSLPQSSCKDRCTYKDNACKLVCGKLLQSDCSIRSDCSWNTELKMCEVSGATATQSINTLQGVVDVISYSLIIHMFGIIYYI